MLSESKNLSMACSGLPAGWVGFDKDMGATRTLAADSAGDAMEATAAGMEEIELRTKDPLRMYRIWRKVGARSPSSELEGCNSLNGCKEVVQTISSHVSADIHVALGH